MARRPLLAVVLTLVVIAVLVGSTLSLVKHYQRLPEKISQHETYLLGQSRLVPGSTAAVRLAVRDTSTSEPLPGAEIAISLKPENGAAIPLFSGQTDSSGTADVSFKIPANLSGAQTLLVETRSKYGADTIERAVTLERDYRVLLTTDKPLYQPGQVIHMRALALSTFDLLPASGADLDLIIADGKGNKVFRQRVVTDAFGAASADFQLAGEVNTGAYKITAQMGNTSSEKTVTVEHYVLPKFQVQVKTDRSFYRPGDTVSGTLQAGYFFGKPVAGGKVLLEGYTYDVSRNVSVTIDGETGEDGSYAFEFALPDYIAGSDLEGGQARFYLQASVTDQTLHAEVSSLSLPVSQSSLVIQAVPEGGYLKAGLENILYVMVGYPDGTPAEASISVDSGEGQPPVSAQTGAYGLAEVPLTVANSWSQVTISARDASGASVQQQFYFEGEYTGESVLLRSDKPIYRVGESMMLDLISTRQAGTLYLDIIREGQTVSTRAVTLNGGRATLAVDLTPDLYGSLELHAYLLESGGAIIRDTRMVIVDRADDLSLHLALDADVYRPGDTAGLDILVSGSGGEGVRSALGLAIVDESVFALAEQDPGFARLYFMLEADLMTPKIDLHGFSIPDLMQSEPGGAPLEVQARQSAAKAALAVASPVTYSLNVNSHQDNLNKAYARQAKFFDGLVNVMFALMLLSALAVAVIAVLAVRRERKLGRSLLLALGFIALMLLPFIVMPMLPGNQWATGIMDRVQLVMNDLMNTRGVLVIALLGLWGLIGLVALFVAAVRGRDTSLGAKLVLSLVYLVSFGFLIMAASGVSFAPSDEAILVGLGAHALLSLAFVLRSASHALNRRLGMAVAGLGLALFLLVDTIPAVALAGSVSTASMRMGGPMMVEDGIMMEKNFAGAPAGLALPQMAPQPTMVAAVEEVKENEAGGQAESEPPRLRQYFPETMLWLPDALTDENGTLHLDIPVADSITTWRMTALASSQDGRLGSATGAMRVFQDFFIDLDLPLSLTVGDEVSIPVGVFNYLPEAQTVTLKLEPQPWFELLDEPVKTLDIASNEINVVYFRIRAGWSGLQPFQVTAIGSQQSDAIRKQVQVYPDGKPLRYTHSDRLTPGVPVSVDVPVPADTIPGTQTLLVKVYPGVLSQVVEGLDSILQMPNGCFEQTSSTTYPNVLVLDYLRSTNQASPESQMKAEQYINLGYQRLTTFEVGSSGGFSLFGDAPADRMLTAYGLQEFADMARVHDVDRALIERAASWLMSTQASDGSWENDRGLVHENTWANLGNDRLPVTAYIVWSLIEADFAGDAATQKGLAYVREHQAEAEDPYALALVANALVAADIKSGEDQLTASTEAVLERLAGIAVREGSGATWSSGVATFMGAEGDTGSIETTALAAYAFLRADRFAELANAALTALIQQKDSFGNWHSTQATVLTLKALIQSVRAGSENADAKVRLTLNGGQERVLTVNQDNFDVVQMVSFDDINIGGEHVVELSVEGKGSLMYQVTAGYYLPWDKAGLYPELAGEGQLAAIDVRYDRTNLAVNDTVNLNVTVSLAEGQADSALVDLGIPPGFEVMSEDLAAQVARFNDVPPDYPYARFERYEMTGRQVLVYLRNLSAEQPLEFSFRLKAKYPLRAQAPASNVYDYYNPQVSGESAPQLLTVE